jgi:hypothetical protein
MTTFSLSDLSAAFADELALDPMAFTPYPSFHALTADEYEELSADDLALLADVAGLCMEDE